MQLPSPRSTRVSTPARANRRAARRIESGSAASSINSVSPALASKLAVLRQTPRARAHVVAQAKRWARDPLYPSQAVLQAVSVLLAAQFVAAKQRN